MDKMASAPSPLSMTALREAFRADEGLGPVQFVSNLPIFQHDEVPGPVDALVLLLRFHWAAGSISIPFTLTDALDGRRSNSWRFPSTEEPVERAFLNAGFSRHA